MGQSGPQVLLVHPCPSCSNLESPLSHAPLRTIRTMHAPVRSPAGHTLYLRRPDGCTDSIGCDPGQVPCRFVVSAPGSAPALHAEQDSEQAQHGDMLFAAPGGTLTHQVPPAHEAAKQRAACMCLEGGVALDATCNDLPALPVHRVGLCCWQVFWGTFLPRPYCRPPGRARLPATLQHLGAGAHLAPHATRLLTST